MGNYYGYEGAVWAAMTMRNRENFAKNLNRGVQSIASNAVKFGKSVKDTKIQEEADQRLYTQAVEARNASKNFLEYTTSLTGQKLENADSIVKPVPDLKTSSAEELKKYIESQNKAVSNYASLILKENPTITSDQLMKIANLGVKAGIDINTVVGPAAERQSLLKTDTGIKQTIEAGAIQPQPAIGFQNPETEAVSGDVNVSMADLTKAAETTQQEQQQGPWAELGEEAPQQQPIQTIGPQQPAQLPTKEEAARMMAGKYTKGEAEGSLAYGSLKSETDIAKEKQQLTKARLEEEKLRISKVKLGLQESKESNINWYREQVIRLKGMAQQLNEAKDDLSREKARADLVDSEVAIRSLIADGEKELKDLKNKTNEFGEAIPEDTIETGKKQKEIEDLKSLLKVIPNLQMQTIKLGTHVDLTTGKVSPAGTPPKETPAATSVPPGKGTPAPTIGTTPKLPPRSTGDTAIAGTAPLQGTQKSKIPAYNSLKEAAAAGKKKGDIIRVKINGAWKIIRIK